MLNENMGVLPPPLVSVNLNLQSAERLVVSRNSEDGETRNEKNIEHFQEIVHVSKVQSTSGGHCVRDNKIQAEIEAKSKCPAGPTFCE